MNPEILWAAAVTVALIVVLACSLLGGAHWALNRFRPNGPDVGMALMVENWNVLREDEKASPSEPCNGPLIWFETLNGAVVECSACHYFVTTGNFMDAAHAETPLMREGLAS